MVHTSGRKFTFELVANLACYISAQPLLSPIPTCGVRYHVLYVQQSIDGHGGQDRHQVVRHGEVSDQQLVIFSDSTCACL